MEGRVSNIPVNVFRVIWWGVVLLGGLVLAVIGGSDYSWVLSIMVYFVVLFVFVVYMALLYSVVDYQQRKFSFSTISQDMSFIVSRLFPVMAVVGVLIVIDLIFRSHLSSNLITYGLVLLGGWFFLYGKQSTPAPKPEPFRAATLDTERPVEERGGLEAPKKEGVDFDSVKRPTKEKEQN